MTGTRRWVGQHVKRVEDPRLLRGEGRFLDDLTLPRLTHLAFVRSPHAHARIESIELGSIRERLSTLLVLTAAELGPVGAKPIAFQPPGMRLPPRAALAADAVRYVGQPVVAVVASERYEAWDAAESVLVDYEPLPAVMDPERAVAVDAPRVHPALDSNVAFEASWESGDVDGAFRAAGRVVRGRFVHPRVAAVPMEPRGCVALYQGEQLTVWLSTQMPHWMRADLAETLSLPEHRIRVIAPDVGGGFGVKGGLYDDELVTIIAALRVGRPVKWVETRRESFVATTHGRGQAHEAELAVAADGTFLGLRVSGLGDLGALPEASSALPPMLAGRLITGAYRIRAASYRVRGVYTNRTPSGAYRGAGRPEGSYLIERLADLAAAELGMDPVEIRRRNLIRDQEFPYRTPSGLTFDSGRYELTLARTLELVGYDRLRAEQVQARREGRYLGLGVSAFVETAGTGPSKLIPVTGWEYGSLRVDASGRVTAVTGISPHGQGQETTFAQIVADELGVPMEDVHVLHGDTRVVPAGSGTFGSRGTSVGGSALYLAAQAVRDKARRIAAHLLEAAVEDVRFEDGRLYVHGHPSRSLTFREVARIAYRGANLPAGMDPGLEAARTWDPPDFTVPFGVYVAVVEVMPDTGVIRLLRFAGVDDVGNVLSPLLLEGQLHGGIAQGIGQALLEQVVYDESGQCLTGTLMDYAIPRADDLPLFELDRTVTPTPVNPLGAKGVGEAGSVGTPAAIVNAVQDALRPLSITALDMPLAPERIWQMIQERTRGAAPGS